MKTPELVNQSIGKDSDAKKGSTALSIKLAKSQDYTIQNSREATVELFLLLR
jgi:hypothetical protein